MIISIIAPLGMIMGYNATVFRVTLEKMPSECLQNCPRNGERSSSSEDSFGGTRTAFVPESRGERGIMTLLHGFCKFCSFLIGINLNVLKIASCGIMTVLKFIIPRFTNKPYDYDSTEIHNHTLY